MSKKTQVKIVRVSAYSVRNWWFRPFWVKSMEQTIMQWEKKGWKHIETTPLTNGRGRTINYLLRFER